MSEEITLSLDVGSSSFKLLVISSTRGQLHSVDYSFETFHSDDEKHIEIDGSLLWKNISRHIDSFLNSLSSEDYPSFLSITTQRESVLLWTMKTGEPLSQIISWQDTRTDSLIDELSLADRNKIRERTGLWISSYCSAPKISYLLNKFAQSMQTQYLWGTLESWLIYKFSQGLHFVSDCSSASRTALFNLHTLKWDPELFEIFKIPFGHLPKLVNNDAILGKAKIGKHNLTIKGVIGDQQAALYASHKLVNSSCSLVHGTGAFVLYLLPESMNLKEIMQKYLWIRNVFITLAWKKDNSEPRFALELSFSNSSQAFNWLLGNSNINFSDFNERHLDKYMNSELKPMCYPFFSSRWFMSDAKIYSASFIGINAISTQEDIFLACLEGLAYSIRKGMEILKLPDDVRVTLGGGLSLNNLFSKSQATFLNMNLNHLSGSHLSGLGAGLLSFPRISFKTSVYLVEPAESKNAWVDLRYQKWVEDITRIYR